MKVESYGVGIIILEQFIPTTPQTNEITTIFPYVHRTFLLVIENPVIFLQSNAPKNSFVAAQRRMTFSTTILI